MSRDGHDGLAITLSLGGYVHCVHAVPSQYRRPAAPDGSGYQPAVAWPISGDWPGGI